MSTDNTSGADYMCDFTGSCVLYSTMQYSWGTFSHGRMRASRTYVLKAGMIRTKCWLNVWVAGKTVWSLCRYVRDL